MLFPDKQEVMKMKKIISLLMCILLLATLLAACGKSSGNSTETDAPTTGGEDIPSDFPSDNDGAPYTYVLNGVTFAVDDPMAPVAEKLGEPSNYFESESCAFQGLDKTYTYDTVDIATYCIDDVDYILSIALYPGAPATPEGVSVGSTRADVLAAYGEPLTDSSTAITYGRIGCNLTFILDNDTVSSITYMANVFN